MDLEINKPLVSISCLTYNHEQYIAQCLEGLLMQKTNFDFEILVHDDASTDSTAQIIRTYENRYLNKIKPIYQTVNQYSQGINPGFTLVSMARGKYIATCEGDDYWTDHLKLQKQVDFLESNHEFGLVHHDADYFFQKTGKLIKDHHKTNSTKISDGFVFEELLRENNIYTPTVLFKKNLFKYYLLIPSDARKDFLMVDYVMWLEFSQHCKFHYIPQSMATYRVLENSASKFSSYDKAMAFVDSYFDIRLYFIKKFPVQHISIEIIEQWRLSMYISTSMKYRRHKEASKFAGEIKIYSWRTLLKRALVRFPAIFRYIQRKNKH